jgi:uncharacterized membrane protein
MRNRERFTVKSDGRPPVSPTALVGAAAVLLLIVLVAVVWSRQPASAAAPGAGSDVALPVADFADGQAKFYRYTTPEGRDVRFFVMRSADGVIRAAFDTCDVCYQKRKGYRQEGDVMVCNNCGQRFHSTNINEVRGGCNPAPLDRVVQGDRVVIGAAALAGGSWYF